MVGRHAPPKRRVFGRESARRGAPFGAGGRQRRQELARIDRTVATTQLEMELWLGDAAGGADARYRLATGDLVAAFDQHQIAVRIGRDPAIGVLDENEVAVTA